MVIDKNLLDSLTGRAQALLRLRMNCALRNSRTTASLPDLREDGEENEG